MTPNEFLLKLSKQKSLQIYELNFKLLPNNKVIVVNLKTGKTDDEIYKSPTECYFVYQYTLKQTDASRIHNSRAKNLKTIDFGGNDANNIEYRKEYGFKY